MTSRKVPLSPCRLHPRPNLNNLGYEYWRKHHFRCPCPAQKLSQEAIELEIHSEKSFSVLSGRRKLHQIANFSSQHRIDWQQKVLQTGQGHHRYHWKRCAWVIPKHQPWPRKIIWSQIVPKLPPGTHWQLQGLVSWRKLPQKFNCVCWKRSTCPEKTVSKESIARLISLSGHKIHEEVTMFCPKSTCPIVLLRMGEILPWSSWESIRLQKLSKCIRTLYFIRSIKLSIHVLSFEKMDDKVHDRLYR